MEIFLRVGNVIVLILIIVLFYVALDHFGYLPWSSESNEEYNFVKSSRDADGDGVDDYTDILNGARKFINLKPKYKDAYYSGGYPDDDYYVSSDIIWYSLKEAGYDFKKMIDDDIASNTKDYDILQIDTNIDFRKIKNIKIFLDKYAESKTLDAKDFSAWQGGDIVIFDKHIAIVSDKRNVNGINYIIHLDENYNYEEDSLENRKIIGHYRFNLSKYNN